MSLLVLMYHRAREGRHGNSPAMLDAHFAHVAANCPNVLPGDVLHPGAVNVCLTFDDGYFDFYAMVFPLLQKYQLRALLAIPPNVVRPSVDVAHSMRIAVESDEAFENPGRGGFCTWPELEEMAESGRVSFAAHGFTHCRLDRPDVNLEWEIDQPKTELTTRLHLPIESFVFPFGRFSDLSLARARPRYRYLFRIGGALNHGWNHRVLYRVDADEMESPTSLFSPARFAGYRARYYWNRLRMR